MQHFYTSLVVCHHCNHKNHPEKHSSTQFLQEFPYYEWFNFTSESSYYRKYVILVVYIHAKNAFIHHDYDTCLAELWSVKTIDWRFKWAERL